MREGNSAVVHVECLWRNKCQPCRRILRERGYSDSDITWAVFRHSHPELYPERAKWQNWPFEALTGRTT